jgi:uncharacterized protein (DUF305 family)
VSSQTEELFLRFMLMMTRAIILMANERLGKGQVKEILDLKRDLVAALPAGYQETYK